MLCQIEADLSDRDLSHLTIWQAYLRKVTLHQTNLAHSNLAKSAFIETFSQVLSIAFSPNGKLLAASDISYEVHIWQVIDGKKLQTCKATDGWAWSVSFSPDSRLLASSANGTIHLWNVQTGECIQTIRGYTSRVFSLAFSPDGQLLASGNEDHEIRIWSVTTGELIAVLSGHTDEVRSVAFSPDGYILASCSYDRTIKLWELSGIRGQETTGQGFNSGNSLPITHYPLPNSNLKAQTSKLPHSPLLTLTGHSHWVWSVAFSPDGETVASSSSDRTIRIWDVQTGHCIQTLTGHTQAVRSIAFALVHRTEPQNYEHRNDSNFDTPTSPPLTPSPLTPPPNHYYLVSGSDDLSVRIWSQTGDCLRVLHGHTSWISAVAASSDGCLFASGSEDQSVRLWDSHTNACLRVLQGYNSGIWSIAFSPDGNTLVSGGQDRRIRLWTIAEFGDRRESRGQETRGQGAGRHGANSKLKTFFPFPVRVLTTTVGFGPLRLAPMVRPLRAVMKMAQFVCGMVLK